MVEEIIVLCLRIKRNNSYKDDQGDDNEDDNNDDDINHFLQLKLNYLNQHQYLDGIQHDYKHRNIYQLHHINLLFYAYRNRDHLYCNHHNSLQFWVFKKCITWNVD